MLGLVLGLVLAVTGMVSQMQTMRLVGRPAAMGASMRFSSSYCGTVVVCGPCACPYPYPCPCA